MIELNYTLLIQAVNFFVFLLILNFLFFKPLTKAIEERNKQIEESTKKAAELGMTAESQMHDYREKFEEARKKAVDVRDSIRKEGLLRESEIIEEARKRAAGYINSARQELEKEVASAKVELHNRAKEIAVLISGKVLSRGN